MENSEEPLTKEQLLAKLADGQKPISLEELSEILDTTVKHDRDNKIITFLGMLLSLTEEDAINISFAAESSTGKSYIPLELAWYFPNVIEYCYVSPTAFFHDYGNLIPDPEDKRDVEDDKKRKIIVIDLHRKNLIFMDQPHDMLLQRLRPLLSHDRKQLDLKITDRNEKHGLRTKTVRILGFPSVIFCCSKFSLQDQERTRLLLLSPDTDENKIRDAIKLKILRESDRQKFQQFMDSNPKRKWLKERVSAIATYHIKNVIIDEDLQKIISERFFTMHKKLVPRNQRDITRLLCLIKAHALLNLWSRKHDIIQDVVYVSNEDVEAGFTLYKKISEANELGLPPEVHKIYLRFLQDAQMPETGITRKEFQHTFYQLFNRTLGKKRFEEVLNLLEATGLAMEEPDPTDRRQLRVIFHKINIPEGVGSAQL